jgi:prolipoprotein diacylglyceryltransferase
MQLHFTIDLFAIFFGVLLSLWFRQRYRLQRPVGISGESQYHYYLLALIIGLAVGSIIFGSLNNYLAGNTGFAKSMMGGIFGAIVASESFKYFAGIYRSTGLYFIPGLIVLIVIGRIGCFYAGLADFTYGTPTNSAWGVDFGDGIQRHPVQLYESLVMLFFLIVLLISYPKKTIFWQQQGFYLFVLIYATQRFIWEFLKPYPTLIAELNLFHLLSLTMIVYAIIMMLRNVRKITYLF